MARKKRKSPISKFIAAILLGFTIIMLLTGCCAPPKVERQAHYENAELFLPMLINYIEHDEAIDPRLKEARILGVKEWQKLIESKNLSKN